MDKTVVEKQAKEILDKFARALERVASDKVRPSFVERADFVREEGGGKPCEGFKQSLLENAPCHDDDFILTEKGSFT